MALTTEDLKKIKLPLSNSDYIMLHEEEINNQDFWEDAPEELIEEYENLMIKYYDIRFPGNSTSALEIPWTPPV